MTFGTRLRQLRELRNLSQQQVAEMLDIKQSSYSNWESDVCCYRVDYLVKLAVIFEVSETDLLPTFARNKDTEFLNNIKHIKNWIDSITPPPAKY